MIIVSDTTPFLEVHSEFSAERVSLLLWATGLNLGESEAIILADENNRMSEKVADCG